MMKLTYFPIPGRAYTIRVCFGIAKIPFEDERITGEEFGARKGSGRTAAMPLGSLPVLALGDGKVATQSMAIARYVAKLAKLYPANPLQALFVDEVLDVIGDIMIGLPPNPDTEEGKKQRLAYLDGKCKIYFSYLAEKLQAGGHFLFGTQATLADVQLYFALKYFCTLPLIPADYTAQWPQFAAFVAVYENDAVFSAYKI